MGSWALGLSYDAIHQDRAHLNIYDEGRAHARFVRAEYGELAAGQQDEFAGPTVWPPHTGRLVHVEVARKVILGLLNLHVLGLSFAHVGRAVSASAEPCQRENLRRHAPRLGIAAHTARMHS